MIAYLKGVVVSKENESLILETSGVGYEVFVTPHALHRLPDGQPAELFITESSALYGGTTTLYGFLTREEKEIFLSLKEHVPSTGAKKALEYLDKASRSLPDFRRAILDSDSCMLCDVFGFTKKTAEKLIGGLKDTLGKAHGAAPAHHAAPAGASSSASKTLQQALNALLALGYKPAESRQVLQGLSQETSDKSLSVEDLIRLALKQL